MPAQPSRKELKLGRGYGDKLYNSGLYSQLEVGIVFVVGRDVNVLFPKAGGPVRCVAYRNYAGFAGGVLFFVELEHRAAAGSSDVRDLQRSLAGICERKLAGILRALADIA